MMYWGLREWYGRKAANGFHQCLMPDCQGFASKAEQFVRHMKQQHGIEIEARDVITVNSNDVARHKEMK
jgi:hypothetical protein